MSNSIIEAEVSTAASNSVIEAEISTAPTTSITRETDTSLIAATKGELSTSITTSIKQKLKLRHQQI